MSERRRGKFALTIYLYTLFCMFSAVVSFMAIAYVTRPEPPARPMRPPPPMSRMDPGGPPPGGPGGPPPRGPPTKLIVMLGSLIMGGVVISSVLVARRLIPPLRQLEQAALAFGQGDYLARTRLHRNDEIGAVGRAFDDMADRITTLMRSQRELMANVSHELRTPLSRMRVALELAEEGKAADATQVLRDIDKDVSELETLVNDVITSARLDLSTSPIDLGPVDPNEIVASAAQRFRTRAESHPLTVESPAHLPSIAADSQLLRRAVDNLLDNARKYSDSGREVLLRARKEGNNVVFEVEDLGIGMSAADQAKAFMPFFRADPSRQRDTGGVGLGLSLCKKIVEAHRGTISLHSEEGKGTRVRIEVPAAV